MDKTFERLNVLEFTPSDLLDRDNISAMIDDFVDNIFKNAVASFLEDDAHITDGFFHANFYIVDLIDAGVIDDEKGRELSEYVGKLYMLKTKRKGVKSHGTNERRRNTNCGRDTQGTRGKRKTERDEDDNE